MSSGFSKEPITTKISPIVEHGPFLGTSSDGCSGTVVGFSKYEGVRKAFEENFARRLELGSQLVVYEKGEKIIDLYGYAPEKESVGYDGDTLQNIQSSGKNMEAIAMAMLVDRGLVDYDDLVTKHWPEFGTKEKNNITIADVMRHSGGVPFVIDPDSKNYPDDTIRITLQDVIDVDPLEQKLASAERYPPLSSSPDVAPCYHAVTRGWIVNAILRRADPSGRSLSRFLREEITDPLSKVTDSGGEVKFFCGIPKEDQPNYKFANLNYEYMSQKNVAETGYNDDDNLLEFNKFMSPMPRSFGGVMSWNHDSPEGRLVECSSGGMCTNARSMAIVNAAAMAGDGSFRGVYLLSPNGVSNSMGDVVTRIETSVRNSFGFSRGGYSSMKEIFRKDDSEAGSYHYPMFAPNDKAAYGDFKGWGGFGGSLSIVDREKEISFAYCMNAQGPNLFGGPRTRRVLLELQKSMAE